MNVHRRTSPGIFHSVAEVWFEQEVQARLAGRAYLIRYADDFVIGFTDQNGLN